MKHITTLKLGAALTTAVCGQALAGYANMHGVIVLQSGSSSGALSVSGNGVITAGPVGVHSTSNSSVTGSGNGVINCTTLKSMGGFQFSGNFVCNAPAGQLSGLLLDPCGLLTWPTAAASPTNVAVSNSSSVVTIPAGTHSNVAISGGTVTFAPGIHIITNGMSISGQAKVYGTGVMLVMAGGAIAISGQVEVRMTPLMAGEYAGITIAQPATNTSTMAMSGGSKVSIGGTIYAPTAQVNLTGQSDVAATGAIFGDLVVAKRLALSGQGRLRVGVDQGSVVGPPAVSGLHD